jgi:hypothetical protein
MVAKTRRRLTKTRRTRNQRRRRKQTKNASQKGSGEQGDLGWLVSGFADMTFPCLTCNRQAFLNDPFSYLIQKGGLRIPVKMSVKKLAGNLYLETIPKELTKAKAKRRQHTMVIGDIPGSVQWNQAGDAVEYVTNVPKMDLLLTCNTPEDVAPLRLRDAIDQYALDIQVQIVHRGTTQEVKMIQPAEVRLSQEVFTLSGCLLESIDDKTFDGQEKFKAHLNDIGYVDVPQDDYDYDAGAGGGDFGFATGLRVIAAQQRDQTHFMALRGVKFIEQKKGQGINMCFNSIVDHGGSSIRKLKMRFDVDISAKDGISDPDEKLQNLINILLQLTYRAEFALFYHGGRRGPKYTEEGVETAAATERLRAALVEKADSNRFQELPLEVWKLIGNFSGQSVSKDSAGLEPEPL